MNPNRILEALIWATVSLTLLLIPTSGFSFELPTAEPEEVGLSSERLARITQAMGSYIDRRELPGAVTLVARHGKVVHFEAHGLRDFESGDPMTRDVIFRISSMVKPITAVAAMMLQEEGHFQLSDPISKFLPEFSEPQVAIPSGDAPLFAPYRLVPAVRPITIQHLLTHTSGLASGSRGFTVTQYEKMWEAHTPQETLGEFVERLARLPLNFQPGEQWEYGDGLDVIARLIEVVTGQTLDGVLGERIFEPLGMSDTYFYLPTSKLDRFAASYQTGEKGGFLIEDPPTESSEFVREPHVFFSGSAGLVSTAADYFKFLQMMLNGGELNGVRLLGRKTVELMTVNHTRDLFIWAAGPGHGYGLGFGLVKDRGLSGKSASEGSYFWAGTRGTVFLVDPREELIAIMMAQSGHLNFAWPFRMLALQAVVD